MIKTIEQRPDHTYWYAGREFPAVSRVLDEVGFKGFYKQSATGAPRGTEIHKAIADYLNGDIVTDWVEMAVKAAKFLDDTCIVVDRIEAVGGLQLPDIAGQVDIIGLQPDGPVVVDWKTGKPEKRHFFQMQLYCHIWGIEKAYLYYLDDDIDVFVPYDKTVAESIIQWYYIKRTRG